jgi:hyaluronan synthase
MLKNNRKTTKKYRFDADRYYPWLVFAVTAVALLLTWCQVTFMLGSDFSNPQRPWSVKDYLAAGLSIMMLMTLIWRISFAWRYRAHEPVSESRLPTVTVVIPAFNEGMQVLSTVRSVVNSRYPAEKLQIICVDDGSRDDTWQWMERAQREFPSRVQLIRQPANKGKRHALMAGFAQATGEIFVTIDSDSEVLPDTLLHLVSPYVRDPRVGAVAGNVRVLNQDEGAIPKMMEVSFTSAFDFIRSGQSVYGGVFCTPGALSSYRAKTVKPHLTDWAGQKFMGIPAAIGEDRALTNLVLGLGFRVVYQREAVVLTKMPVAYSGLRRMLLRWARSNVRENLVMLAFLIRRFRPHDSGAGWIRFFTATQLFRMTFGEAFKFAVLVQLALTPLPTIGFLTIGCLISAVVPAVVHQKRRGGWFGWKWALPYTFYWLYTLSWIPLWGVFTASRSGWLTRDLPEPAEKVTPSVVWPNVLPGPPQSGTKFYANAANAAAWQSSTSSKLVTTRASRIN